MGKTHALSGLAVGLVVGPAVGVHEPIDLAVFAGTTAGFAVFPDIDHPKSSATRKLGIAGRAACKVMRGVSRVVYKATRGRNDRRGGGVHRHLSHTVLFALLLGGVSAGLGLLTPWATVVTYVLGGVLAADRLGQWAEVPVVAGGTALIVAIADDPAAYSWQMGAAAALGCIVHCLGDAMTKSGCPFLFPLYVRGETWFEIRLLGPLSLTTNSPWETWFWRPLFIAAAVLASLPVTGPLIAWANTVAA